MKKKKKFYSIKAKGDKQAEILLYDEIGNGFFGGVGAKEFVKDLTALGALSEINLRINSPGGSVFEGMAIYNALVRNKAKVNVHVDGLAASIASVIAMAGDEINIAENALMMIHNPWTLAMGDSDELRKNAELLDKLRDSMLALYVKRTTSDEKAISDMLNAETWLNAEEAKETGFADNITETLEMAAKFDLSRFKNTPATLQGVAPAGFGNKPSDIRVGIASRRIKSGKILNIKTEK